MPNNINSIDLSRIFEVMDLIENDLREFGYSVITDKNAPVYYRHNASGKTIWRKVNGGNYISLLSEITSFHVNLSVTGRYATYYLVFGYSYVISRDVFVPSNTEVSHVDY